MEKHFFDKDTPLAARVLVDVVLQDVRRDSCDPRHSKTFMSFCAGKLEAVQFLFPDDLGVMAAVNESNFLRGDYQRRHWKGWL